jgi:hypothetical protein
MNTRLAGDVDASQLSRTGASKKLAIFTAKLLVTGACFWYISRQIDRPEVLSTVPLLDIRWAAFATLIAMLEIPLVGLRWSNIVNALCARDHQLPRAPMVAATAVGSFFAQVFPSVAGEGMRAWLLVRLGSGIEKSSLRLRHAFPYWAWGNSA